MNQLTNKRVKPRLLIKGEDVKTTSLAVAEMFGKEHYNVLRDIERLVAPDSGLSEGYRRLNFEETLRKIPGPNGAVRDEVMYELAKDGFVMLVMGYTGAKAMAFKEAYINAFNVMEHTLVERRIQGVQQLSDAQFAAIGLAQLLPVCGGHRAPAQVLEYLLRCGAAQDWVRVSIRTVMAGVVGGCITTGGVHFGLKQLKAFGFVEGGCGPKGHIGTYHVRQEVLEGKLGKRYLNREHVAGYIH